MDEIAPVFTCIYNIRSNPGNRWRYSNINVHATYLNGEQMNHHGEEQGTWKREKKRKNNNC